jgi:glycosyltransferase involved in cell wall biosynthesis
MSIFRRTPLAFGPEQNLRGDEDPVTMKRERHRPRVLYLSFFFPPSRASGVYRARATANHLAANGWDVTALAAPMRFLREVIGSVDDGLVSTVDPRIRVERPSMSTFAWEHDLRRFSRFRAHLPLLARKIHAFGQRAAFPEPYARWGFAAAARALRLHSRKRFDVVLATGNPFASFAGAWLFHRMTGVPYVIDYRDSWTLDLFNDAPAFPPSHIAWKWERRVIKRAAVVVFVNENLRAWHMDRYPAQASRMMVVPNGWDPDLFEERPALPAGSAARPLRFAYLGTLTSAQPVEELLAGFQHARSHAEIADAELNIHGYLGFFKHHPADFMARLGLYADGEAAPGHERPDLGVRYRGPVEKTQVASVYETSDVLVFLAGGGHYVTSGKIFEYMASGRPIVSVHAPGIAAEEVLRDYPLWFTANSLDPTDIAQAMIAAGKAARDLSPEQRAAALRHADSFTRATVLTPLEATLRSLAHRGHRSRDPR